MPVAALGDCALARCVLGDPAELAAALDELLAVDASLSAESDFRLELGGVAGLYQLRLALNSSWT